MSGFLLWFANPATPRCLEYVAQTDQRLLRSIFSGLLATLDPDSRSRRNIPGFGHIPRQTAIGLEESGLLLRSSKSCSVLVSESRGIVESNRYSNTNGPSISSLNLTAQSPLEAVSMLCSYKRHMGARSDLLFKGDRLFVGSHLNMHLYIGTLPQ